MRTFFSSITFALFIIVSCKQVPSGAKQSDMTLFDINKVKLYMKDSIGIDVSRYLSKIEDDLSLEYLKDSVLEEVKQGLLDEKFNALMYSTGFNDHKLIKDSLINRYEIGNMIISNVLNSLNTQDVSCVKNNQEIKNTLNAVSAEDFFNLEYFNSTFFQSMIYELNDYCSLTKDEILVLLFIDYYLREFNLAVMDAR